LYDEATYNAMRSKIIAGLELAKKSKFNVMLADKEKEPFNYSYKLLF
jgi:hypothetical protein